MRRIPPLTRAPPSSSRRTPVCPAPASYRVLTRPKGSTLTPPPLDQLRDASTPARVRCPPASRSLSTSPLAPVGEPRERHLAAQPDLYAADDDGHLPPCFDQAQSDPEVGGVAVPSRPSPDRSAVPRPLPPTAQMLVRPRDECT